MDPPLDMEKNPNQPPIRAIIWDLGGVLVRTEDESPRKALARRFGMSYDQMERLVYNGPSGASAQRGEISAKDHWTHVMEQLGLSTSDIPQIQKDFWGGDMLDDNLVRQIRQLKKEYQIALLSNAMSDLMGTMQNKWKIADAFDQIIISSAVGMTKPDHNIYKYTLELMKLPADHTVFIDDTLPNIFAAREIGMQAIHFINKKQTLSDLRKILSFSSKSIN